MIDAQELVKRFTVDDFRRLIDSYSLIISSETDKEIVLFQYDRYPIAEVENHKPKLYFYCDTKILKNYITGKAYNIINFLMEMYSVNDWQLDFKQSLEILDKFATGEVKVSKWEKVLGRYKKKNYKPSFKIYDESILDSLPSACPLDWLDNGISIEACQRFEIKEYRREDQIVLPVRLNNQLIGIRVRNRNPELIEHYGKYRPLQLLNGKIYNFSTNGTFYGFDEYKEVIKQKQEVYIVEGEKSVLKAYTWYKEELPCIAMFGHSMSEWKRQLLKDCKVKTIYYVADCDFKTKQEREEWWSNIKMWCQPLIADGFDVYIVADWSLKYINTKENAFDASTPDIFKTIFNKKKQVK